MEPPNHRLKLADRLFFAERLQLKPGVSWTSRKER
jgi:hypothetical protein